MKEEISRILDSYTNERIAIGIVHEKNFIEALNKAKEKTINAILNIVSENQNQKENQKHV